MPRVPFNDLPPDARLWIFPAERLLSDDEEKELLARADAFLDRWEAHGAPLTSGRDWRYGRFLLVAVDEAPVPPSGCSIDAMTKVLKELGSEFGMTFLDRAPVLYRDEGEIRSASRREFQDKAEAGEVDPATIVFDNSITRISDLESGKWETAAGDSWHRRAFFQEG